VENKNNESQTKIMNQGDHFTSPKNH